MVDALNGLRHNAVVRRDHKDRNVGHHRAAGAHRGKGLVTRSVEEGDRTAVDLNSISADVLRNAARLAGGDVRVTDIVKQRGLAVVDVTHNNDDRRTGNEFLLAVCVIVDQLFLDRDDDFLLDLAAELHRDQCRGVIVDHVGNGGEHAQLEQLLDDLGRRLLHAGGQLAHSDLIGDLDLELLFLCDLKLQTLHLVALLLAALGRGDLRVLALLVLVADLFLLAAAAAALKVVSAAGAGKIFKFLVVLFDVYRGAASRINDAFFRDLTRHMRLILLLGLWRLGDGSLRLRRHSGVLRSGSCLFRGSGSLSLLLFLLRSGLRLNLEDLLKALDLVVLGDILEDYVELVRLQHLHMVFRRRDIIRKDLGNGFGRQTKILSHLMHSVFDHTHMFVLLFPIVFACPFVPFSLLRRCIFSCRRSSSCAASLYFSSSSSAKSFTKASAKPISVTTTIVQSPTPSASDSSFLVKGSSSFNAFFPLRAYSAFFAAFSPASDASARILAFPARAASALRSTPISIAPARRISPSIFSALSVMLRLHFPQKLFIYFLRDHGGKGALKRFSLDCFFQTATVFAQIRASARRLSAKIETDLPLRRANHTDQLPFGFHFTAAETLPHRYFLLHVLRRLSDNWFLRPPTRS